MKSPCSSCPWRRDAPRGHWHDDHFRDIWTSCQDDGIAVMLCHKATLLPVEQRQTLPCRGWILVIGTDAIGVRLLLARGTIDGAALVRPAGCPPLFETFSEMLVGNGITPPARNRYHGD